MSPARPEAAAARADLRRSAPVFAALGDPTRLAVVARLCGGGPLSVVRLTAGTRVTRQAISKHLRVLARAGLVQGTRRGRERVWAIRSARLEEAQQSLQRISAQWDQALARLQHLVER